MKTSTTTPTLLKDLFPIQCPDEVNPEDYRDGILFGSSGSPGILNHPSIPRTFAQPPSGTVDSDLKWHSILFSALRFFSNMTNDAERVDTILLPWAVIFSTPLLKELHSSNIKTIGVLPELGAGFTRYGDSALLYSNNPENLKITVDETGAKVELYSPQSLLMLVGI